MSQTVTAQDVSTDFSKALGTRLKTCREELGLSCKALAEKAGIPFRSIEKYEYGTQEPNASRLHALAKALGHDVSYILSGESESSDDPGQDDNPQTGVDPTLLLHEGHFHEVQALLAALDQARDMNFAGHVRKTLALARETKSQIGFLEYEEILELARERDLFAIEGLDLANFEQIMMKDPCKADKHCAELEERIIDTAIFGVDLYAVHKDNLRELADACIGWATPHILKHSVVSWLAEDGHTVDQISDLTGTHPNTVRRIYRKFSPEYLAPIAETLSRNLDTANMFVKCPSTDTDVPEKNIPKRLKLKR